MRKRSNHSSSETAPQCSIPVARADLAEVHRLLRLVYNRTPGRELRQAILLIEGYLPPESDTYDHTLAPRHRPL